MNDGLLGVLPFSLPASVVIERLQVLALSPLRPDDRPALSHSSWSNLGGLRLDKGAPRLRQILIVVCSAAEVVAGTFDLPAVLVGFRSLGPM